MRTISFAGTVDTESPKPAMPSRSTVPDIQQVWNALAEIGRQLNLLAGAQTAQGNFSAQTPPLPIYGAPRLSLTELVNLFLVKKSGKSDRYIRTSYYVMKKIVVLHGNKPSHEITTELLEQWLDKMDCHPRTKRNHIVTVRSLFNFAMKRGIVTFNPAAALEFDEMPLTPSALHSPETVKAVLNIARDYSLDICRALAIRYFAGLRTAELERLSEEDIKEKYIEVTAAKSKTRARRLVTIQPNLRAWLSVGGSLPAAPQNGRKMLNWQRHLVLNGITWPKNVARHSFVSYHVAKFQNAGKTALEAGHTEQMLFANYRETATPEAGEAYFNILPD